jgi:hypothetical protein
VWWVVASVSSPACRAQTRKPNDRDGELKETKLDDAEKKELLRLQSGKELIDDDKKKLLSKASQSFLYRFTKPEFQFKPYKDSGSLTDSTTMQTLREELFRHFVFPEPGKPLKEEQKQYMREFAKALQPHIKKLLGNEKPIARVNAAMVLARLGETGLEEVAPFMCDVIEAKDADDAVADMVKLYALAGLKNVFRGERSKNDTGDIVFQRERFKNEEAELRCVKVLIDFINRKPARFNPATPSQEVDAYRWIRREAIRALAATRFSVIKAQGVQLCPARELVRVLANAEAMEPKPSLSERLEAATGLCQVQPQLTGNRPIYYPSHGDYAAYHVGRFVVDFASRYDAERSDATSASDWKYSGYRLGEALKEMKDDARGKSKYVDNMVNRALPITKKIVEGVRAEQRELSDWLEANKAPATELFSGITETELKGAPAASK